MTTKTKKRHYKITVSQDVSYVQYWDFVVEAASKKEAEKIIRIKMDSGDISYTEDSVDTYKGEDFFEGMNSEIEVELINDEETEVKDEQIIKAPCKIKKPDLEGNKN